MRIGIIKEGKTPPDKRVPVVPAQCKTIMDTYDAAEVVAQHSDVRQIPDAEYSAVGVEVVDDISNCDVLMGVKEVPIGDLVPGKTYFFFSHTIKKQAYNRKLLQAVLEKNILLVDYETLTNAEGFRLLGFGRYAGIVGCYNAFYAWGQRHSSFDLKRAHLCADREEMESELSKVELPNIKIVVTGKGRVGRGAREILDKLGLREVRAEAFLDESFDEPVFCQVDADAYRKRGSSFDLMHFFDHPEEYENDFLKFAHAADMYIACHFWDARAPLFYTQQDAAHPNFNLQVVADISCDITEPIASTIRPSTIDEPLYGYDPQTGVECDYNQEGAITVMAVDNLPCELPRDSSADFGEALLQHVFPYLLGDDSDRVIERATIARDGQLMSGFAYLQDYVDGKE